MKLMMKKNFGVVFNKIGCFFWVFVYVNRGWGKFLIDLES